MFDGFNERYQKELQENLQSIDAALLSGRSADYAEYKFLVGKRLGILQSLQRHQELLTLMKQANDE